MLANLWIVILLFYSTRSVTQSKISPVLLFDGDPKHFGITLKNLCLPIGCSAKGTWKFGSFYMSFFLKFAAKFDKDTLFFQVYHLPKLQLEYHTLVNKTLLTNHTCYCLTPKGEWFGKLIYLHLVWQKWCHLAGSPETIWLYHKYSHVGRTGNFITGSLLWHDSTRLFHRFPCF